MFLEIFFFSSFITNSGKFSKFDSNSAILFQIKVFSKNIKETTLASYFTKVTVCPSFTRLKLINQTNRVH